MPDGALISLLKAPFSQAAVILLVSLAATVAAWRWTDQQAEALESVRFNQYVAEVVNEVGDRMARYNHLLLSGAAFFASSDEVRRDEWRRFVVRLDIGRFYPGTLALGYAVRVSADQWSAHETAVRSDGFPNYRITPPGIRELAFPVVYIEPFSERNQRAFGFDMFSEPMRREAMTRAMDSGQAALTGKVVLVQESDRDVQPGVLLYLPFYGNQPSLVEGRRAAIQGFVYSPLRMGDLIRAVLGERLKYLCVQIYDQQADDRNLLFANTECVPGGNAWDGSLDVFGRQWIVRVRSTSELDEKILSHRSLFILGAGAIISVLLVWAVMSMLAERRRRMALDRALAELEQARAEVAGALAAKGRFMAAASHDLRQPLQSLGLFLRIMIEQKGGPGSVERAAQQSYEATVRLVEAMFDAAALESGRAKPTIERVDVAELITNIADESRVEAESRGLFLRQRVCQVEVETDKVMLERILRNLVGNALKYTSAGGVLIACRKTRDTVRIKVADSGPGIPEDKRELIFEDFYQIENPERDPRKGLGLGLATVSRMARALGFNLHVLSREGMGSTFVVEIPRAAGRPEGV
ncbi:MAG: CHASE domain-containing protein [Magnetospirillum sp.]|nr:CHASE domain-containing protein [Magnetospirillum sp.]